MGEETLMAVATAIDTGTVDGGRGFLCAMSCSRPLGSLLSERVLSRKKEHPVAKKPSINKNTQIVGSLATLQLTNT